jgi:glycosyltransferase involved in cell wall biosynthesis
VLFLGRLSWKKGLDRLLAALSGTGLRLLVAGGDDEGFLPELRRLIERHQLGERVELVGQVGERDKWALLRGARLLVLSSYNENLGNVVLEAMAVGCPVVVTEEVGAASLVREAGCGVVSAGNPHELRAALLQVWNDDAIRSQMGQAGIQYARSQLSWRAIAQATVAKYRTLVARAVS